jgi:hypothetical protein
MLRCKRRGGNMVEEAWCHPLGLAAMVASSVEEVKEDECGVLPADPTPPSVTSF